MFYICKRKEKLGVVKFGVMDTNDGVVEYYTPQEIISFVSKNGILVEGVTKSQDGKWKIKVLQPTSFKVVEDEVDKAVSDFIRDDEDYDYWLRKYEDLPAYEQKALMQDTLDKLYVVIRSITDGNYCFDGEPPVLMDGLSCVGFSGLEFGYRTNLVFDIFFNPDCTSKGITASGFGLDLYYRNGKHFMLDGDMAHFDGSFCNYVSDFKSFRTRVINECTK